MEARRGGVWCVSHFSGVSTRENNTKEPRVSIKDRRDHESSPQDGQGSRQGSSHPPPLEVEGARSFLSELQRFSCTHLGRVSGPGVSNFDTRDRATKQEKSKKRCSTWSRENLSRIFVLVGAGHGVGTSISIEFTSLTFANCNCKRTFIACGIHFLIDAKALGRSRESNVSTLKIAGNILDDRRDRRRNN